MPRPAKSQSADSTANFGFKADSWAFGIRQSAFGISSALPGQLFYSTQIPVCLWFLAKNKAADAKRGFRDRCKQTLFSDSHSRSRVEHEAAA